MAVVHEERVAHCGIVRVHAATDGPVVIETRGARPFAVYLHPDAGRVRIRTPGWRIGTSDVVPILERRVGVEPAHRAMQVALDRTVQQLGPREGIPTDEPSLHPIGRLLVQAYPLLAHAILEGRAIGRMPEQTGRLDEALGSTAVRTAANVLFRDRVTRPVVRALAGTFVDPDPINLVPASVALAVAPLLAPDHVAAVLQATPGDDDPLPSAVRNRLRAHLHHAHPRRIMRVAVAAIWSPRWTAALVQRHDPGPDADEILAELARTAATATQQGVSARLPGADRWAALDGATIGHLEVVVVSTVGQLNEAGRRFSNCLGAMSWLAADPDSAVVLLERADEPLAAVQLGRRGEIVQALGPHNAILRPWVVRSIEELVGMASDPQPALPTVAGQRRPGLTPAGHRSGALVRAACLGAVLRVLEDDHDGQRSGREELLEALGGRGALLTSEERWVLETEELDPRHVADLVDQHAESWHHVATLLWTGGARIGRGELLLPSVRARARLMSAQLLSGGIELGPRPGRDERSHLRLLVALELSGGLASRNPTVEARLQAVADGLDESLRTPELRTG